MDANFERDVNRFWSLLFNIVLDAEQRLAAHLAAHDLTPPQFYVLKTLAEHGGHCPIGQIARLHHLTNATMTGLVQRLEAMSPPLVVRERSAADRRSVEVRLTEAGQARFLAVQTDVLAQVRAIFRLLSGEEREDLIRYLSLYFQVIEAKFPVEGMS